MKIGAYFYPLTTQCAERARRGKLAGALTIDEHELVAGAQPLYAGHRQPRRYCLGTPPVTSWDDAELSTMACQVELAQEFGLSFFVFNTYIGRRAGSPVRELGEPLERAVRARQMVGRLEFAVMLCLAGPHAFLPLPNLGRRFDEPERDYDLSRESIGYMMEWLSGRLLGQPNYLHIKGRPYVALYADLGPGRRNLQHYQLAVEMLREQAMLHGTELYIVGICASAANADEMQRAGVDALSGYAFLPDFGNSRQSPVQDYASQVEEREQDWHAIALMRVPFVPPAVVGWDASARGARGYRLEEVRGVYPFTPIVEGSTPELFAGMLRRALSFIGEHVPVEEQYGIVCAWNEIAEGCSLLPEVTACGAVDIGYLEALKAVAGGRP